jgi:TolB-like protein/Tfp pilus assembly protein PilF/predicted Ser/Thr protein kinase
MANKCPKCDTDNPSDSKFCKECATPFPSSEEISASPTETLETPKEELTTGFIFAGRYQIIEVLGKGGMGKVYRALDKKLNEEVALKLVKPEIASDKKTLERFSNELKIARKIAHKNVGRMYELMEEKGTHFITMEYVPGEDLKSFIKRAGPLSAGKTTFIAKQVCAGLAEAHELGVVHRDLKPQNIMIDKEGNSRIMDFGIARSLKAKGITDAGVMIGTPEYMSPEQVDAKETDQRSDIYSLGVILYEMVTGRVPFEGDTPLSVAVKQKTETPEDPRKLNSQIPVDLSNVILRCMEKDKEKRYQSTGELRSELDKIEEGIPTTERVVPERKPITSREITVTFGLKKLFLPGLVVTALVIAAVVIWQFLPQKEAVPVTSKKPSIAVLPFVDLSPQKDQEYFCDGMTDEIIAKLSRFEGWKVIPRTSMMRYKNTDKDIQEIGQELDVITILEGSLRKEKDDIRVNAKLIRVEDSHHLWSDTYEKKLESVFAIQGDVAEKIADALKVELSPEDKEQLAKKPTENLNAYDYYLKGRGFYYHYRRQDNENAIELFKKALELDPNYALAYAGLGDAYAQRTFRFGFPRSWLDSAIEVSEKAISIDPNSAEAYKALGLAYEYKGWYQKALEADRKAVELNPNYKAAVGNIGWVNWFIGEYVEAMKWFKKGLALDPTDAFGHYSIGNCYFGLDDYVKAEQWFRKSLDLQPDLVFAHQELSVLFLAEGKYQKAIQSAQKILSADPNEFIGLITAGDAELYSGHYDRAKQYFGKAMAIDPTRGNLLTRMGYVLWKTGQRDEAQKMFSQSLKIAQEAIEQGSEFFWIPYHVAAIHAIQGNKEEALKWMKKAVKAGFRQVRLCQRDPILENLHQDDRFKQIIVQLKEMVDEMRKRIEETE